VLYQVMFGAYSSFVFRSCCFISYNVVLPAASAFKHEPVPTILSVRMKYQNLNKSKVIE
jgi:hypothetical protein